MGISYDFLVFCKTNSQKIAKRAQAFEINLELNQV